MYLMQSWFARFMQWAGFGFDNPHPVEESVRQLEIVNSRPEPVAVKKSRTAKSKTQERPDAETFAELLEGLEESFETLVMPDIKGNWLSRKETKGLRKLGIYIPTPWLLELVAQPSLPVGTAMPMMASCLICRGIEDTKEEVHPRFAFAIKAPRLPENVEQIKGVAYQFGYCFRLNKKEKDLHSPMRSFWAWAYIVVRPDGSISIPSELQEVVQQINHRRAVNGSRKEQFSYRQWRKPSAFTHDHAGRQEEYERFLKSLFRQLILWWNGRAQRWSVGVRKNDKRVTFSIAPQHTAAYFADRDKTIAVNGTAKKIIHYVRPHTRANGSHVKAHVRGLREFDWKGFHCMVTAPDLNGQVLTVADLTPVEADGDDPKLLETHDVAALLADSEDFPEKAKAA